MREGSMQILLIQSSLVLPSAIARLFDECLYSITHPPMKKSLGHKAVYRLSVKRCSDRVTELEVSVFFDFFLSDSSVITFC